MTKNQAFHRAPIGAKISVTIAPGIRHYGRKFDKDRIFEFSKARNGWAIVDVQTFSKGKPVHISTRGHMPNQTEMLRNQQKYAQKKYSLTSFNCDAGQNVLAGHPPKSHQVNGGLIGAASLDVVARANGVGLLGVLALMAIGGLIGAGIANAIEDGKTQQPQGT